MINALKYMLKYKSQDFVHSSVNFSSSNTYLFITALYAKEGIVCIPFTLPPIIFSLKYHISGNIFILEKYIKKAKR